MSHTPLIHVMVADVLAANPASARLFIERGMGCVGCPFAPFETVGEAARAYGMDPGDLARALAEASGSSAATPQGE